MIENSPLPSEPAPVQLSKAIYRQILDHCVEQSPLECCGVLGGKDRTATSIYRFTNILASENRYEADPNDIIRAVQDLRSRGEEFVAIYHSHPRWKPIPSRTDLERNGYGELPQIIVGLLGEAPEVRAWSYGANSYVEIRLIVSDAVIEATASGG